MNEQASSKEFERAEGASGDGLLGVLRRRWWVVALCAILFPAVTYFVASHQTKLYSSQAVVLLNQANLANSLTDTPDPSLRVDRDRQAKTQVEVAQLSEISERTLKKLKITDLTPEQLQARLTVAAAEGTDLLTITVEDTDPERAKAIAGAYAYQYTGVRARLDTRALATTLVEVRKRLNTKHLGSDLRDNLKSKEAQLSTLMTLQTRNSIVMRGGSKAEQIAPTPKRDAALALLLGLIVGCTLALILDGRDRRIRDARQIAAAWGLPLIGRVPPDDPAENGAVAMVTAPRSAEADAYRFVVSGLDPDTAQSAHSLLVVSASDGEGRSQAAANLAVAFARSGEHVLAIDLDFEGARLSRLFGSPEGPGASDVALGSASWELAARQIPIDPGPATNGNGPTIGGHGVGTLTFLPGGTQPASAPDFVGSRSVEELIDRMESTFDRVLIDAPGLLGASDALLLSHSVDAVIAVASVRNLNRDAVDECGRLLDRLPVPVVGLVSTADTTPSRLLARSGRRESRRAHHPAGAPTA